MEQKEQNGIVRQRPEHRRSSPAPPLSGARKTPRRRSGGPGKTELGNGGRQIGVITSTSDTETSRRRQGWSGPRLAKSGPFLAKSGPVTPFWQKVQWSNWSLVAFLASFLHTYLHYNRPGAVAPDDGNVFLSKQANY